MEPRAHRSAGYRSAAATPRTVRDLVFDRLPSVVRDRLTHGVVHGAPEPLLAAPSGRAPLLRRALIGVAVAAALAAILLAAQGFADPRAPLAWQPAPWAAAYGGLFFLAAAAGAGAVEIRRAQRGAPFRSGRYLFPLDLVEADGGRLRVTPLDTLREVEARERAVAIRFEDGHTVVFPLARSDDPALAERRVKAAVDAAAALVCPADAAALERLDPFFEVRLAKDWSEAAAEGGGRARSRLPWILAGAALVAAPAGLGILHARNATSDDMMFEEATTRREGEDVARKLLAYTRIGHRHDAEAARLLAAEVKGDLVTLRRLMGVHGVVGKAAEEAFVAAAADDADALSWYLGHGGGRVDQADEALFALARRLDTVPAYDTYLEHGKRHADEVRKDLLPDADFAQASRSPQVGSLLSFVRRNPGAKHEDEAWRRIHEAYARALPAFTASERPSADALRFAEALLAAVQDRSDPRIDLEIRVEPPTALAAADELYAGKYGARYLPGAPRFSPRALADLSENVRFAVNDWFGRAFPGGVVEPTRPSPDAEGRPRVEIRCEAVPRGTGHWRKPDATSEEDDIVTPEVALVVEVQGLVPAREGNDTTIGWEVRVEDTDDGGKQKMQITDFRGNARDAGQKLEDAFAHLLEAAPTRIAASFQEKL